MIWMNHKQLEAIGHASLMENGKFQYEIFYSKEYKKGYSLTTLTDRNRYLTEKSTFITSNNQLS